MKCKKCKGDGSLPDDAGQHRTCTSCGGDGVETDRLEQINRRRENQGEYGYRQQRADAAWMAEQVGQLRITTQANKATIQRLRDDLQFTRRKLGGLQVAANTACGALMHAVEISEREATK